MTQESFWSFSSWGLFLALLAIAGVSDIRKRRVPNWLTGLLLAFGIGHSIFNFGLGAGLSWSISGLGTGLVIWLPMYALRLLGAGDVKLFAAGAAWLGWKAALLSAVSTGLIGGVLGFLWMWHRRGWTATGVALAQSVKVPQSLQLQPLDRRERVPYALAIAGGLLCGWWWLALPEWRL